MQMSPWTGSSMDLSPYQVDKSSLCPAWLLKELEESSGCWKLCSDLCRVSCWSFPCREKDDELHRVYLGFLELSGAVQIPGNGLFQLFILLMAHLSGWGRTEGSQDPSSDSWGFLWFQVL